MVKPVRQEGVILRKMAYGEADEIVTVLFRQDGVRRLFATGSRKSKKRFAGLLDVFANLELEYKASPGALWRLHKAEESADPEALSAHPRILESDLDAFAFFHYLAELICEFTPEELQAPELYHVWGEAMAEFQRHGYSSVAAAAYLVHVFTGFGYALGLDRCAVCGSTDATPPLAFIPERGGRVCHECVQRHVILSRDFLSPELFDWLAAPHRAPVALPELEREAVRLIYKTIAYARTILQKKLRSEEFYLQMLNNGQVAVS